jgi:peptidoglycan/LPS O-acetylase OafA/YrhL
MFAHAFPVFHGAIGVDMFFVISGFLMTKMITGDLDRDKFTFGSFYLRRARRLLPASLVTIC